MKKDSECVKVIVRIRPFNQREKENGSKTCVQADEQNNTVDLFKAGENERKTFAYDYVFNSDARQASIYEKTAFNLVESVVEGYNGTIFAYGQTGCGKTFTMSGVQDNLELKGIIPRTFEQVQTIIEANSDSSKKFLIRCSFIEIYNEEIRDLLGKDHKARLELKEMQGVVSVKDITMITVKNALEMDKYMQIGTNNRSVGATAMNAQSSRSHCIFTLYVETQVTDAKGREFIRVGKLNLVDLAGSERQAKTQATGDRLKEATKINLSLSALGNVISALVDGKTQHIPYRDSKLTRLLQDSLGGNTKTIMITAISPADFNYDETLSSLRYASRAKMIQNKPKVNEDPKDALLKQQADEIRKLKEQLSKISINPEALATLQSNESNKSLQTNIKDQNQQNQQTNQVNSIQVDQIQKELQKLKADNEKLIKEKQEKDDMVSKQKQKELDKLIEDNNNLLKEKQEVLQRIAEKEQNSEQEKQLRKQLQQLITEKEKMVVTGGKASEEDKKKYRLQQKKLKQQSLDHEKLLEEREKQSDELYDIEQKYQNVQEEVEALRKKLKQFRNKCKGVESDLRDIQKENEVEKEELLDSIRSLQRENKLYEKIMKVMFKDDEIQILKADCVYDEDNNDYQVPPFIFRQNKIVYPNLPLREAQEFIESEKNQRNIELNPKSETDLNKRTYSRNKEEIQSDPTLDKQSRQQLMLKQQQQQVQELEKLYPAQETPQPEKKRGGKLSPIRNGRQSSTSQNSNENNIFKPSPMKQGKPTPKPHGKLPPF